MFTLWFLVKASVKSNFLQASFTYTYSLCGPIDVIIHWPTKCRNENESSTRPKFSLVILISMGISARRKQMKLMLSFFVVFWLLWVRSHSPFLGSKKFVLFLTQYHLFTFARLSIWDKNSILYEALKFITVQKNLCCTSASSNTFFCTSNPIKVWHLWSCKRLYE